MANIQTFDFSVDLLKSLLWQHDNAEGLVKLIQSKQDFYNDQYQSFWDDWIVNVFNLQTANDFGLSVWSIILNIPLEFEQEAQDKIAFGFGLNRANFSRGNFGIRQNQTVPLTLEQKRLVLRLRYFQLISRGTVTEVNSFLDELFGQNQSYVLDNLDMSIFYVFLMEVDDKLREILVNFDLLPRPAGVGVGYVFPKKSAWGFGLNRSNFDRGNFATEGS